MATYYVKPTSISGSDGNNGTTFALAKATLNAVYALCSAGDTVRVCSDASDDFEDVFLTLNGADAVDFVGADTTDGTPYTGSNRAVITDTGANNMILAADGVHGCRFYNISLQGTSSSHGFYNPYESINHTFINCEFKDLLRGIRVNKGTASDIASFSCFDCVFDGCTTGILIYGYTGTSAAISLYCINCLFKNNSYGIYITHNTNTVSYSDAFTVCISECRFVNNFIGYYSEDHINLFIDRSIFYINSSHGISFNNINMFINVRNSIFHSNGGYGIYAVVASDYGRNFGYVDHNCYYNNTSGTVNSNINGGTAPGSNNTTSDPLFASTTSDAEDFRLQATSPCLDAGIGYVSGQ